MKTALPNLSLVRAGFELEGIVPWQRHLDGKKGTRLAYTARLAATGLAASVVYINACQEWRPDAWVVTQDESIRTYFDYSDPLNEVDIEIKSPILSGTDADKLPGMLQAIDSTGLWTNDTCALHLHVSPTQGIWTPQMIRQLYKNFIANRDAFEQRLGPRLFDTHRAPRNPHSSAQQACTCHYPARPGLADLPDA